jgi:hypothetical protein
MVMDQDQQLRMLMESSNPKLLTAGRKMVAGGQKGTDAVLNPGVSITKDNSNWQEPELYSPSKGCAMVVASDTGVETSDKGCGWDTQGDTDLWKTPEQRKLVISDCSIGVNKFYKLIEEESNHSKWVEFRKLAQKDSATEECSTLLERMELEVSEDEEEIVVEEEEEEVFSLEESGILPKKIEKIEDKFSGNGGAKKNQKRKTGWGPILRAPRPRRVPEDGRSMMEKAQDLKKAKNLEKGTYTKYSFAYEDNAALLNKASCVNISLGVDPLIVNETIDSLKSKELEERKRFEENNPEVNLPDSLESVFIDEDFPPLNSSGNTPSKENTGSSDPLWVQGASKGKDIISKLDNNDRGFLER